VIFNKNHFLVTLIIFNTQHPLLILEDKSKYGLKNKVEKLTKTTIRIGSKQLTYYRPNQARTIPLKATSNRGFTPSLKPHLKGLVLEYESQLERDFIFLLDHDPNCVDLQPQPVEIEYTNTNGRNIKIYPDFWAIFLNEKQFLFEIKSESQLQKLVKDEN